MTVELNEKALKTVAEKKDKIPEIDYNSAMTKYMVAVVFNEVDSTKSVEEYVAFIDKMHPDDLIKVFSNIWNSGERSDRAKFR